MYIHHAASVSLSGQRRVDVPTGSPATAFPLIYLCPESDQTDLLIITSVAFPAMQKPMSELVVTGEGEGAKHGGLKN
jgi:hypothetical protein